MRKNVAFTLCLLFALSLEVFSQVKLLQSGPMVGYSEMKEVVLWVQTTQAAKVKIEYWEKGKESPKFTTEELITEKKNDFAVKLLADQVLPDKKYTYRLLINSKEVARPYPLEFQSQVLWQYRKPAPDITFAVGSCNFINDSIYDRKGPPFGGNYEIYTSIFQKKPDFMMWLGDNVYLREADWNTKTGIYYRNTHTRSLPEMQPLLGSVHHYAIWDDHDYGPNDSDRSFWNKDKTTEAFNMFWCNPNTNQTGQGGITGTFQWGDAQFFLLDNRSFRSPNNRFNTKREYLGNAQVEWLIDALVSSNATFKFVCIGGQVLNPVMTKENYSNFEEEHSYLLKAIKDAKVKGVFFFSGDRHHSELTKLDRTDTYPLYDLTVSSLTSRPHEAKENNYLRVDGTLVGTKNFGIIKISGANNERKLKIMLFDTTGKEIWTREITTKELE
jgi:alkaline phosphatase D